MAEMNKEQRMLQGVANIAQRYIDAQECYQLAKDALHDTVGHS